MFEIQSEVCEFCVEASGILPGFFQLLETLANPTLAKTVEHVIQGTVENYSSAFARKASVVANVKVGTYE